MATVREVAQVCQDGDCEENSFLVGGVQDHTPSKDGGWHISLNVGPNGRNLDWCIDTGAQVSVMPANVYTPDIGKLCPSDSRLNDPSDRPLGVKGFMDMDLAHGKNTVQERVFIANASKFLLGAPAIRKLGLIKNIPGAYTIRAIRYMERNNEPQAQVMFDSLTNAKCQYPQLFTGLGRMKKEQKIEIADCAKPFAWTVPRRVPLPLLKKVEAELDKVVKLDVIETIDTPTDWCAPLVVVPKANGDVRLCVDLTMLNKSVKRETYAMPSVEETLSKISKGSVFSKLDANSGFHSLYNAFWLLCVKTLAIRNYICARVLPKEDGQDSPRTARRSVSQG